MITQKDIETAVNRNEAGLGFGGGIGFKFLNQVSVSCRPVAHSNEAATFNRANMFAIIFRCVAIFSDRYIGNRVLFNLVVRMVSFYYFNEDVVITFSSK